MSGNPKFAEAFAEKLAALEEAEGSNYSIVCKGFDSYLVNNRLNPCWFTPGEQIATVERNGQKAIFEISGILRADLYSPNGEVIRHIEDVLVPIEDIGDGFHLLDDKDLTALVKGTYLTGHYLKIHSANSVFVYTEGKDVHPIEASKTSVARAILDPMPVSALMIKSADAEDLSEGKDKRAAALEKSLEDITAEEKATVPKEKKKPAVAKDEAAEKTESTEKENKEMKEDAKEPMAIADEAEKKSSAETKKKSSSKSTKSKAVKTEPKETGSLAGRCDLLPLDIVGTFLSQEASDSDDAFTSISKFTQTGDSSFLLSAAKTYAAKHYDCDESAILDLAVQMEIDANEHGEEAWKETESANVIVDNAIRHLLMDSRGDKDVDHGRAFFWTVFCGAWLCANRPGFNTYDRR